MNYYLIRNEHDKVFDVSIPGSEAAMIPVFTELTVDGQKYTVIYAYHDKEPKEENK